MTQEYPLRPRENTSCGITEQVCQCGHNKHNHKTSDLVMMSLPPQYTYLECETCMCPEYKFEKEYKIQFPKQCL
jgi:hypothetical protein